MNARPIGIEVAASATESTRVHEAKVVVSVGP